MTARSVLAISNFVLHLCSEFGGAGVFFFRWGSFDVKVKMGCDRLKHPKLDIAMKHTKHYYVLMYTMMAQCVRENY